MLWYCIYSYILYYDNSNCDSFFKLWIENSTDNSKYCLHCKIYDIHRIRPWLWPNDKLGPSLRYYVLAFINGCQMGLNESCMLVTYTEITCREWKNSIMWQISFLFPYWGKDDVLYIANPQEIQ